MGHKFFPLGWFCSLPPVQYYGLLSIVLQALCLLDLIPWIYLSFPLYVQLEKTLESPLESKEIKPVNPKGNQPWILFGSTGAETEASILWPSDVNSWLTGKNPDAGKDQRQKEKRMIEDEMLDGITDSMDKNLGKLQEMLREWEGWHATVHRVGKSWTWLSYWTITKVTFININKHK